MSKLIFDIGMHTGRDTKFYLEKGFRVIAVEAAPNHIESAKSTFVDYINSGQLVIVDRAIFQEAGKTINFYINPEKDDWGSIYKFAAEKGMENSIEVSASTTTLLDLVSEFGSPYYLKCDIEGADEIVVDQLIEIPEKPKFLSIEINHPRDFDKLVQCGYDAAQLINQNLHPFTSPPKPAREGTYVDAYFDGHTSGLFGLELDPEKWIPLAEAKDRYIQWNSLRMKDPNLGFGWLDVHVRLPDN